MGYNGSNRRPKFNVGSNRDAKRSAKLISKMYSATYFIHPLSVKSILIALLVGNNNTSFSLYPLSKTHLKHSAVFIFHPSSFNIKR